MHFKFVKHSECSKEKIIEICQLKAQHWDYPLEKQLEWIENNIENNDVHLILQKKKRIIGYLTLVPHKIEIDKTKVNVIGIGNVCVDDKLKGQKIGFLIMQLANYYLEKQGVLGVLMCKKNLIDFYKRCNWIEFEGYVSFQEKLYEHTLFFNKNSGATNVNLLKNF